MIPVNIISVITGIFLIAHGIVHVLYRIPAPDVKWPFKLTYSWLLTRFGVKTAVLKMLGTILWVAALAGFVLGGLGALGVPGIKEFWRVDTAMSAVISFVLIGLFWHRNFWFALLMNAGIFISLVWLHWPTVKMVGW